MDNPKGRAMEHLPEHLPFVQIVDYCSNPGILVSEIKVTLGKNGI